MKNTNRQVTKNGIRLRWLILLALIFSVFHLLTYFMLVVGSFAGLMGMEGTSGNQQPSAIQWSRFCERGLQVLALPRRPRNPQGIVLNSLVWGICISALLGLLYRMWPRERRSPNLSGADTEGTEKTKR